MNNRKKKLGLSDLKVASFVTQKEAIRAGEFLNSPRCGYSAAFPDACQ